jgi:hypothetical protein
VGTKTIIKIAMLNLAIVVLNIVIFSKGLLDIEIGGTSVFETAFGFTAILMSFIIFVLGNYKLISGKKEIIHAIELKTVEDCIIALKQQHVKKTFSKDIANILEQIERFMKKKETLKDILLQKFNIGEMSYLKFEGAVLGIQEVFYINIKSILNKLNAFDEQDYNRIRNDSIQKNFTKEFIQTKLSIYNEYIVFVKDSIEDNEQILLKLDKLLLEISKFSSLEDGEIEKMSAMIEVDELINKTKLYK